MTDETEDTDQYDTLLRAMEGGLLISVNDSTEHEPGTWELEVQDSKDGETYVECKAGPEEWKVIHRDGRGKLVVGEPDEWAGLRHDVDVETIEVLGIA